MKPHTQRICQLAQEVADAYHIFNAKRAGSGAIYTREVVDHLKHLVLEEMGAGVVNQFLSKESHQAVDFWLATEQTMIAVELNLLNGAALVEREAFKALLAKDAGADVRHLVLLGDPGSARRHQAPAPRAVMNWMDRQQHIRMEICELAETGVD